MFFGWHCPRANDFKFTPEWNFRDIVEPGLEALQDMLQHRITKSLREQLCKGCQGWTRQPRPDHGNDTYRRTSAYSTTIAKLLCLLFRRQELRQVLHGNCRPCGSSLRQPRSLHQCPPLHPSFDRRIDPLQAVVVTIMPQHRHGPYIGRGHQAPETEVTTIR